MLKQLVKAVLPESTLLRLRAIKSRWDLLRRLDKLEANAVRDLGWRVSQSNGISPRDRMRAHEFQVFSQQGEDGILLYIFSVIGTTDRRFIEFGFGDGRECNTANLSINFGWSGLMMDGSATMATAARGHFSSRREIRPGQITIANAFITAENINDLFREHGKTGELDLLSIDIDGNDYWVWRAIDVVRPRVVVIEYNASFTLDQSITVPYEPAFDRTTGTTPPGYHGASLPALVELGREKGYSLVGCNSLGFNAFFLRNDLLTPALPVLSAREAFYPNGVRCPDPADDWKGLKHLPYVQILPPASAHLTTR